MKRYFQASDLSGMAMKPFSGPKFIPNESHLPYKYSSIRVPLIIFISLIGILCIYFAIGNFANYLLK